ncbi:MAG TPA: superoxide dismutase [Chitinophagaceae bacterium]|nr:superoxide dismutase [Chitinophagaceae bacterium]
MKNELSSQPDRRAFIKTSGKAGLAAGLSLTVLPALAREPKRNKFDAELITFQQQPLPYDYKALEPSIDAMTMEIHYTKHAAGYAKNLADACAAEHVNTGAEKIEDLLAGISKYSVKMRNNAGGHYNHELFWKIMTPQSSGKPGGKLAAAIDKDFGSFDAFKTQFADAAKTRFGSGFAWLVLNGDKKLVIGSTPNQDNPLMDISDLKGYPVMGIDVWEHAYYLKYQNKRPDYIMAWFNIINWDYASQRFESMA